MGGSKARAMVVVLAVGAMLAGLLVIPPAAAAEVPVLSWNNAEALDCGDPVGTLPCDPAYDNFWAPYEVQFSFSVTDADDLFDCTTGAFRVDWDGDGTSDEGPSAPSTCNFTVTHSFGVGTFDPVFEFEDADGLTAEVRYSDVNGAPLVLTSPPEAGTIEIVFDEITPADPGQVGVYLGSEYQGYSLDEVQLGAGDSVSYQLPAGAYSMSFLYQPADYGISDLVCIDPSSDTVVDLSTASPTATLELAGAETITCTFDSAIDPGVAPEAIVWAGPVNSFDELRGTLAANGEFQVDFDATESTDLDGDIVEYRFDYGDGDFDVNSTGLASHSYNECDQYGCFPPVGNILYTATVWVKDAKGNEDFVNIDVMLWGHNTPPQVEGPWLSPLTGDPGLEVTADLTAIVEYDANTWIEDVQVNWGDGSTDDFTSGVYPDEVSHTFADPGSYEVCLEAWDSLYESSPVCEWVEVSYPAQPPTIDSATLMEVDCGDPIGLAPCVDQRWAPLETEFQFYVDDPDDVDDCTTGTYRIDYQGNGSWDDSGTPDSCSVTLPTPHTYGAGTYDPIIEYTDVDGQSDQIQFSDTAWDGLPLEVTDPPEAGNVEVTFSGEVPAVGGSVQVWLGDQYGNGNYPTYTALTAGQSLSMPLGEGPVHLSFPWRPAGFYITDVVCVDPSGDSTVDAGFQPPNVSLQLSAGETISCTFDLEKYASLRLEVETTPVSAESFLVDVPLVSDRGASMPSPLREDGYYAGAHVLTVYPHPGWVLDEIDCAGTDSSGNVATETITYQLAPGDLDTCTIRLFQGEVTTEVLPDGGAVSSDDDGEPGANPDDGIETMIDLPPGVSGPVTITEEAGEPGADDPFPEPAGYEFLGWRAVISAPVATDPNHPLSFTFTIDGSLAGGNPIYNETSIDVIRNGTPVPNCTVPRALPCVESRNPVGDDFVFTILTMQASTWDLAVVDTGNTIWGTVRDVGGVAQPGIDALAYSATTGQLVQTCSATDSKGTYVCAGLPNGSYRIWLDDPDNEFFDKWLTFSYVAEGASAFGVSGSVKARWDARVYRPANTGTIQGTVRCGKVHTGCPVVGAPRANAEVRVYTFAGRLVAQTATNASGQYSVVGLEPATYVVRIGGLTGPFAWYRNANARTTALKLNVTAGATLTADQNLCGNGGTTCL